MTVYWTSQKFRTSLSFSKVLLQVKIQCNFVIIWKTAILDSHEVCYLAYSNCSLLQQRNDINTAEVTFFRNTPFLPCQQHKILPGTAKPKTVFTATNILRFNGNFNSANTFTSITSSRRKRQKPIVMVWRVFIFRDYVTFQASVRLKRFSWVFFGLRKGIGSVWFDSERKHGKWEGAKRRRCGNTCQMRTRLDDSQIYLKTRKLRVK